MYICTVSYTSWWYFLVDTLAATVSINHNITGILGNKDTHLTCSFVQERGEKIFSVQIVAKNIKENFNDKTPIAIFEPERAAKLLPSGAYLSGRVTLTSITTISTNATLTFKGLKCTDEKDYMCKLFYLDNDVLITVQESEATRLSVKGNNNVTLTCEHKKANTLWYDREQLRVFPPEKVYLIQKY